MSARHGWAVSVPALLACGASLALAPAAGAATTRQQKLFTKLILEDRRTGSEVRELLRTREGFVDDQVLFADLTGDGRQDAVVSVASGGAAGDVAYYVFSTQGRDAGDELRAVYRSEGLYRSSVRVRRGRLISRVPRYEPTDPLCCPKAILERTLRWSRDAKRFRQIASRELDGPDQG
ncbi:MAG: hypothetical protein ACR2ML_09535 [Solirubrobacteraceae bacterium]